MRLTCPQQKGQIFLMRLSRLTKLQITVGTRNAVVMANFATSFTDEMTMEMIYKVIIVDWPTGGKASVMVCSLLIRKLKPKDMVMGVELHQEMSSDS